MENKMPFGLKQKLNETEKFQKRLDKALKKTARKQMVLDTLQAKRALKEAKQKRAQYQVNLTSQNQNNDNIIKQDTNEYSTDKFCENTASIATSKTKKSSKLKDFFDTLSVYIEFFLSNSAQKLERNKKVFMLVVCTVLLLIISINVYDYFVCYEINLDGNSIGIVENLNQLNTNLDKLQNELQEEYELPTLYFERSVTSKKVIVFNREDVLSDDEIYTIAKKADLPLFCIGGVINIDGADTVKLASVEKAQEALDTFYNYYKESPADWVKVIEITDIDTEQNIEIAEKVISIGSDCTVDEAVVYLKNLCANAIEADSLNGNTVIADLPKFNENFANTVATGTAAEASAQVGGAISDTNEKTEVSSKTEYTIPTTALAFRAELAAKDDVDTSLMLNVRMYSQVEYYRDIPYETVEYSNSSLYKGERIVTTNGVNGKSYVKANIVSENGIQISEEILDEYVYEEPVNESIAVGTRPLPVLSGESKYIMPTTGYVSSTNREGSHSGFKAVDIANREGTGIYAARAGTVIFATADNSGYGMYIKIDHGDGYVTWYAHLSAFKVSVGDYVQQGQLIGLMGSTGQSTGPHLHLEVRYNNARQYIPAFYNIDYGDYVYAFE